ncbi:cytidine deaminase [Mesomycoplasma ovipneumoniae]|uniref:Cytidine deaminase n=1 Tax=Mesomycoplasma ovipneumoniae TaxID=29562 RepID=A0AAP5Y248_9BACT|nr:cytidine deaminase [Mesomycoplasma ovipneumoniae]MDW2907089.1 cytidine deaminase [Mesomycoplasma ovipneumoniae]MDW2907676.1 cytidine deaminase [Mesomycoplasma ovipneumoniae]MDW2909830.1 cytidine deaminase [Mesomycoplasma ovipneumoniae]MDW2912216.1 cytidine deaminase [Mesomycoplasma ovipneumoniae]MDW2913050.1 cytidine deaminase [Mesomycoplasma ovipneumoniae]
MEQIFESLKKLSKNSYCPYSNFPVASILLTKQDRTFEGINVENAVYPAGICAERVAIFQAIAQGVNPENFKEIHIYSPKSSKFIVPCGQCLQVFVEFFSENVSIFLYNSKAEFIEKKLNQLLPLQFKKDFL